MSEEGVRNSPVRRYKAYVSSLGTTHIHLRNPFIAAWWSAAFPGLGHLLLSKYLRGYMFFLWEVFVNLHANINLAIIYSFTGKFDMAKDILNKQWLLLYIPTYFFAIWDSYRTTIGNNNQCILASREDAEIKTFKINAIEINYLDKRTPWASLMWSALTPGAGQLYIHRLITSFYIFSWWITIIYYSKFFPALHYAFLGEFDNATLILNPQWFLNIPSIYFFAMYDAYVTTVENNNLFDWEQSKYFNKYYQNISFRMPNNIINSGGNGMYIVSTFEHSIYLELAITAIQMKGIQKENILAVPMDKRGEGGDGTLFDTIHKSDGLSLLDIPFVLATIFTILGNIYGFILKWGPVLWGLIGTFVGLSLGFIIKYFTLKKLSNRQNNMKASEIVLIIECEESQSEMLKDMLWRHHALGVRKLKLGKPE